MSSRQYAESLFEIGQTEQLLAQLRAVLEHEAAHAADAVGWQAALDGTGRNDRVPAVVTVEVTQQLPRRVHRGIEDRAAHHLHNRLTRQNAA